MAHAHGGLDASEREIMDKEPLAVRRGEMDARLPSVALAKEGLPAGAGPVALSSLQNLPGTPFRVESAVTHRKQTPRPSATRNWNRGPAGASSPSLSFRASPPQADDEESALTLLRNRGFCSQFRGARATKSRSLPVRQAGLTPPADAACGFGMTAKCRAVPCAATGLRPSGPHDVASSIRNLSVTRCQAISGLSHSKERTPVPKGCHKNRTSAAYGQSRSLVVRLRRTRSG